MKELKEVMLDLDHKTRRDIYSLVDIMDDVPKVSEVTEGVNYTDNTSTTSERNTNIPTERLESEVSVDAAPWSPTLSVPLGGTPVYDSSKVSVDTASCSPTPSVKLGDTEPVCDSSKVSVDAASCSPTTSVTLGDTPVCDGSKVSVDAASCLQTPSVTLGDTLVCDSSKVSVDAASWSPTQPVPLGDTPVCDCSKVSVDAASCLQTPSATHGDTPVCDSSKVSVDAASWSPTPSVTLGDTQVCDSSKVSFDATSWSPTPSVTLGDTQVCDSFTVSLDAASCSPTPTIKLGATPICDSSTAGHKNTTPIDDEYYDVVVLYAEADMTEATIFLKHLQDDIRLKNGESIKAALYNAPEVSDQTGPLFNILDKVSKRCVYIFVYLTKNIVDDYLFKIMQESTLMRDVDNRTWSIVPVYTKRRCENNFEIPMGLNALKGISYYANNDLYKKSVSSMVEEGRKRMQTKLSECKQINKPCQTDLTEERGHDNVTAELDQLKLAQPKQGLETARDLSLNPEASTSSTQTSRPGKDQDAPITEKHLNHTRLLNALVTVSADGLRQMLLSQIPPGYNDFYDLLRQNKHKLRSFLRRTQIDRLFPDPNDPESPAKVDQYDITLLCALVKEISSVAGPVKGWGTELDDVPNRDTSLGASTERIRLLRNELVHHKDYQVDDSTFEVCWKKICQIMDDIEAVIGEQGYKKKLRERKRQIITESDVKGMQNKCKEFFDKMDELKDWMETNL